MYKEKGSFKKYYANYYQEVPLVYGCQYGH